ncbi:MAG TPA: tRNA (adenosine(37)-N6)-threonylcarbamoyltransferase complex dimerization subunit type 1 TsaB, partial [Patescibacteria group bacterium]|nr:tRNA (adenosine(37)-N6)-threonylcarbamoyltransferase complex dimerization subunit type 1 TsaB [Patescibacteria group bacterium]
MILVIDTSSALSAVALLGPSGEVVREATFASGRTFDLPAAYRSLGAGGPLSRVAVATGPGSFTGLRVGVSFGVGLAMGLRIPIVPLPTLAIQAARCERPVIAVAEAGRGRVYFQIPGAEPALAEPSEVPGGLQAVGWLRPATELAMAAAGHPLVAL